MTQQTSRRRFLKAAAATGALAGVNATVLAQGQGEADQVILLGGYTRAWQGYRLPGEATAEGSSNPTLNLQEGTTYTLMWENGDGVGHNFAIQDDQGNNLEVLEPISVQSDTFQQINRTQEDQTVSLNITQGNITGFTNVTGGPQNMTEGQQNMTGEAQGQQTTLESLIAKTEVLSEEGAVQGVRFTASPEMAQYICLVHPNTMVGDINVVSGGGGGGANNSSA
ncbi:twin-arginine translocation signal domain-containing protein [Halorussus sp. MSC15.2]|uniref:twin-arginine translocation signal domain-containing protein n=1 Tax=Halorussus sp. MSC15.2 TaxID=2283638 RepID=UPI0013D39847|nr:twin-arginine translocation signal domain-containing protein [Halorussus sp. MSC15.2]NEU56442.1 twin-arginine translocation signal domain-containing protein [Halorussus sp. MSC15.2]